MNFSKKMPEGMKDFSPSECKKKDYIKARINRLFDLWGYDEISTPTLEYYDTFNQCKDSFEEQEMYKLTDSNGRILVMRPDMTIPVARFVVNKFSEIDETLRFRYCSNIYRSNKFYGGRQNEYTDCGVELISHKGINDDIEILALAFKSMETLDLSDYKIEVGYAGITCKLFESMNISKDDRVNLENLIDKKSMVELEEYTRKMDIDDNKKRIINKLSWLSGDISIIDEILNEDLDELTKDRLLYIKSICNAICELGYGDKLIFDMARIPKPEYYSGLIFNAYVGDIGQKVLSGGRYDKLFSSFGVKKSATGFSINLDSIIPIVKELEGNKIERVSICDSVVDAINKAEKLREKGIRAELI